MWLERHETQNCKTTKEYSILVDLRKQQRRSNEK